MESQTAIALKNDLVLEEIFQYLDLRDVKNCRQVNRKWKLMAERNMTKFFARRIVNPSCWHQTKRSFPFPSSRNCSSIVLRTNKKCTCTWISEHFSRLFERYSSVMRELTIQYLDLQKIPTVLNFTPFLTKLKIYCAGQYKIDIRFLENIKYLKLHLGGIIDVTKMGTKMAPEYLFLTGVRFIGVNNEPTILNDYVSFKNSQYLYLDSISAQLDMSQNFKLKNVFLENVQILKTDNIKWQIEHLSLSANIQYYSLNVSQCLIRKFKLDVFNNLLNLPSSIESLTLGGYVQLESNLNFIDLPNLRYLKVAMCRGIYDVIAKCPTLETLEFRHSNNPIIVTLPAKIKTLILNDDSYFHLYLNIQVNKLILKNYNPDIAKLVLGQVQADNVIVQFKEATFNEIEQTIGIEQTIETQASFLAFGACHDRVSKKFFYRENHGDLKLLNEGTFLQMVKNPTT